MRDQRSKITTQPVDEETGLKVDDWENCCFPIVDQVYQQRNIRNSSHANMTPYILTCNPSITLTSEVLAFQQTHVMKVINNKAGQKIQ